MKVADFLTDIFNVDVKGKRDADLNSKTNFIFVLSWFGAVIFPILFVIDLIYESYAVAIGQFLIFLTFAANILLIKNNHWHVFMVYVNTILVSAYFLFLILTGGNEAVGRIWFICYPLIAVFFFGQSRGTTLSFIMFLVCGACLFLPLEWDKSYLIPLAVKLKLLLNYIGMFLVCRAYDSLIMKRTSLYKKQMRSLHEEIKSKDEFISKLSHQIRLL